MTRTESLKVPSTKESTLTQITLQIACGGAKGATPKMTNVAPAVTRTRSAVSKAVSMCALEVSSNTSQMPCILITVTDEKIYWVRQWHA